MVTPLDVAFLGGRLLFGGFFLYHAWNHFAHFDAVAGYAASKGAPAPRFSVAVSGLLLLAGGLLVLTGVAPLVGLAAIGIFLAVTTPLIHAYWKLADPMQRMGEHVNFTKNLGLLGGALALMAVPQPWALGLPPDVGLAVVAVGALAVLGLAVWARSRSESRRPAAPPAA